MRLERLRPEFVDSIPEHLEEGILYVSVRYRTASHLCACGCGNSIVTPIKPAKWKFTYDGDSISLWPSIGNWQKGCKSHYVIQENEVQWSYKWSDDEIQCGRARDQATLREHFESKSRKDGANCSPASESTEASDLKKFLRRLRFW